MIPIIYIFIYCNLEAITQKLYLSNHSALLNDGLIKDNPSLYYSLINIHFFSLCVYVLYIIKNSIKYNTLNKDSIGLALIYIKYLLNVLLNDNIKICEYEFSRNIMWLFATPLMLKMYCDINDLKLSEINIQYHVIPVITNIIIFPYKSTKIYYYFTAISWVFLICFLKKLYQKRDLMFTNIYLFIWSIFMFLNIVDIFELTDKHNVLIFYSLADMISKMMTGTIVNDFYEKELIQLNNMDLQSLQFVSYMLKNIQEYRKNNSIITSNCGKFIANTKRQFLVKIPNVKIILEQELLKKILPLDFDKNYIINTNDQARPKHFNMICILFTDIVNYTELAKKNDEKVIFQLLHDVYNLFDNIIHKYPHLQKIETIGDAYMVAGDIFGKNNNHKIVVKEIILFAFEIINEIKYIKTPDNIPLSIRIGINIGNVSVGILGNEIPRLCVVGNTVNVAARLQSTAEIDTIQISRIVYEQLEDINFDKEFVIQVKENVFLKNIGSVTTYILKNENF